MAMVANTLDKILLKWLSEIEGKRSISELLKDIYDKQKKAGYETFAISQHGKKYSSPEIWRNIKYLADNFLINFEEEKGIPTVSINEFGKTLAELYVLSQESEKMLKS